ncbi:MAG: RidA family protein [Maricaulaceae bacterium]
MIQRIHTNVRSSKIVIHNGTVYLTGQVAEGATAAEQTQKCLDKIDALLAEAGSDKEHILQTTIWLADISDFAEMNEVWNAWVPEGHAPARACGETKLARDILKVEFIVTAAVKEG